MTQSFEFKQSSHLNPALSDPSAGTLNADKLVGRWSNTNRETRGIAEIIIEHGGEGFSVGVIGVGADEPVQWPVTRAKAFANLEEEAGQRALALAVTFDLGFMRAETHIRLNKGVLVIVLFNTFQDGSGRSSYVNREFFYRRD
ncbi:MAG TPA: hypothetical protein VGN95_14185 [Pyrinomonadaceae bacterium]|jgi:hypothetical protein|nr:hypothetical protein [Pyrinomonadaceae bacterium]